MEKSMTLPASCGDHVGMTCDKNAARLEWCTPADFDSVPSNRDDVSIVVRAPSANALKSICE